MSHIFDALQRSEAESGGAEFVPEASGLPVATELLQIAERKRRVGIAANPGYADISEADRAIVAQAMVDHAVAEPAGMEPSGTGPSLLERSELERPEVEPAEADRAGVQTGVRPGVRSGTDRRGPDRVGLDRVGPDRFAPDRPTPNRSGDDRLELERAEKAKFLDQFPSVPVSILAASRLVAVGAEETLGAEKFRFLAVRLRQLRLNRTLKKLLITSTIPQEGKSTVASNLACTLARRKQHKTLLIEGDLRRPTVAEKFGLGRRPGLCEWLSGQSKTIDICRLEGLGFWFLPAGSTPENPLELMQAGKLPPLMEQLASWFDWIVIDSPPVLPLADTSIWSRLADGILLVTRRGITEKPQLLRGLEALERAKLLGAVVNGSTNVAHSDYYHRYTSEGDRPK